MKKTAFHILRIGMAITFIWIGIMVFQAPEVWGAYIPPWAANLMPLPVKTIMLATAGLDVLIGFFLLINVFVWVAGLIGAIHILMVLIVTGINDVTVRDIGLLAATLALMMQTWPEKFYFWKR